MSEADRLKRLRGGRYSPGGGEIKPGDRPIRRRGVYRAATRGQKWALKITNAKGMVALLAWCYYRVDFAEILASPNPFLSKIPKDNGCWGGYLSIPWPILKEPLPKDSKD